MTVSNTSNMTTPFIDLITTTYFNDSNTTYLDKHFCYKVLYWDLPNSKFSMFNFIICIILLCLMLFQNIFLFCSKGFLSIEFSMIFPKIYSVCLIILMFNTNISRILFHILFESTVIFVHR